jgi:hypothetical protein
MKKNPDVFLEELFSKLEVVQQKAREHSILPEPKRKNLLYNRILVFENYFIEEFFRELSIRYYTYANKQSHFPDECNGVIISCRRLLRELKSYFLGLLNLQYGYIEFVSILEHFPPQLLTIPFYNDLLIDRFEIKISSNHNIKYFSLLELAINSRYYTFPRNQLIRIKETIKRYRKKCLRATSNKRMQDSYDKIRDYNTIYHLNYYPFGSRLGTQQINEISELLLSYVFIKGTSSNTVNLLLQGRYSNKDYESLEHIQNNNTRLVIKEKSLGILSYILKTLYDNGWLYCKNLWTSLDNHELFYHYSKNKLYVTNRKKLSESYILKTEIIKFYQENLALTLINSKLNKYNITYP